MEVSLNFHTFFVSSGYREGTLAENELNGSEGQT